MGFSRVLGASWNKALKKKMYYNVIFAVPPSSRTVICVTIDVWLSLLLVFVVIVTIW